jgi:hypothetical protein
MRPAGDTRRVLLLAAATFGGFALLGWRAGVFERLGPAVSSALALFALGFAALTVALDGEVRAALRGLGERLRGDLARARAALELGVPALQVRARLARQRQVEPAVRGAADHDVGRREALAREVAPGR